MTLPAGAHVLLDEDPPALGGLRIEGTLEFARQDLSLRASYIAIPGGRLLIGSESAPFTHQARITLDGDDPTQSIMGMGTRGILLMGGGTLELFGAPPARPWTRLDAHGLAGASDLSLAEAVDWSPGDEIAVAPTDYYQVAETQRMTLASVSGSALTTQETLGAFRWGRLQYASASGMSLDPAAALSPTGDLATTPTVLDERAEVGNLTRNIVIEGPDDALWQGQGFGAHVMIMGLSSQVRVDGVELRRVGQRGRLGRYPWHWHRLSYDATSYLGDTSGHFLRNSSIHGSANRGVVIHATNGVTVADNVVFDVSGHGIFTEDAVERRNTIRGNLVLKTRNPAPTDALKQHEVGAGNFGSSGFWISNPDNALSGNTSADSAGFGFWLAFPENPWGASIGVPLRPNRIRFGTFVQNTAHTSRFRGLMIDLVEVDNSGAVSERQYLSTTDGVNPSFPFSTLRRFHIDRLTSWKNAHGAIWDRAVWADNTQFVAADNGHRFFAGSGADGVIEHCLVVGSSLNDASPRPIWAGDPTPSAFATYHSDFDIRHNIVVGFPLVVGRRSGVFATDDYYLRGVDKGHIHNRGNLVIQSHPGARLGAEVPAGVPVTYFNLAGALWDPYGTWGYPPANPDPADPASLSQRYLVYDAPFYTFGQVPLEPVGGGAPTGGVLVDGPFYGVNAFVVDDANAPYDDLMAIDVQRLNPLDLSQSVDALQVDTAQASYPLAHMRSAALHREGVYRLSFPDQAPTTLTMTFEGLQTDQDSLVVGIQMAVALPTDVATTVRAVREQAGLQVNYTRVASRAEVIASAGETWFQDASNVVWVKFRGGRWVFWTTDPNQAVPTKHELLYEPMRLRIQ